MSSTPPAHDLAWLADTVALAIQRLRGAGQLDNDQPLLRLDPRVEAAGAPFQFDSANAVLHRTGCVEIPADSRSAVYAVWRIGRKDLGWACKKCRPMTKDNKPERPTDFANILLGVLSLVNQFDSILSQRGRDFRRTERGRDLEKSLSGLFGDLSQAQTEGAQLLNTVMDRLLTTVNRYNANGGGNGAAPRRNGKAARKQPTAPPKPKPRKATLSVRR